ncbi:CBO0543 family protein [Metabacillus crassostreae]|uniref:CBO0543 family protein n=1 Tax=Metabacillus crassostreae TaxID=929098 RepID=UPI003083F074
MKEAQVSFLFKQVMTWLFGLIVAEKKLISYPYRLFFKKANKASFTFEYFVYPALCSLFNLYFPEKKNNFFKILYYCFHTSTITVFEVIAEKYTNLINYKKWSWHLSFITNWCTYFLTRIYFKWFFNDRDRSK